VWHDPRSRTDKWIRKQDSSKGKNYSNYKSKAGSWINLTHWAHNRGSKALRVVAPILDIYISTEHPTRYLPELTSMRRAWSQRNKDQSSDIQQLHHIFIHLTTPFQAFLIQGSQYPFLPLFLPDSTYPFSERKTEPLQSASLSTPDLVILKEAVRPFQLRCSIPKRIAETDPAVSNPASFGPFTLGLNPPCVSSLMIGEIVSGCRGN
jgi:hypothetical protein